MKKRSNFGFTGLRSLLLFASIVLVGAACILFADGIPKVGASRSSQSAIEKKRDGSGDRQISGMPGVAIKSSAIEFSKIARKEPLSNARNQQRHAVHSPMPVPYDLQVSGGPITTNSAIADGPELSDYINQSPAPSSGFLALENDNAAFSPDVHGAAGPNHLMTTLNSEVRIQDRVGDIVNAISLDDFWESLGKLDVFSPKIFYDPYEQRWIFTAVADAFSANSSILIGVTKNSDPTGVWFLYRVDADAADQAWADYPSVGFNKDWIVVQSNMYGIAAPGGFDRSNIYVFNKADLYKGGAGLFTLISSNSIGGSQSPAVSYDNSASALYLVQNFNGDYNGNGYLRLYTITGSVGGEVLTLGPFACSSQTWHSEPIDFLPQLGSTEKILGNDARIQNAVYRNGSIWCVHTVSPTAPNSSMGNAVQWWQLSARGEVMQRGRIEAPNAFFAAPSITVNRNNDALIGYSQFSEAQYASASYSFRYGKDPLNALRTGAVLKEGEAAYFKDFGNGEKSRWSAHSSAMADPVNDADMWTLQEFSAVSSGNFGGLGAWWSRIVPLVTSDLSINNVSTTEGDAGTKTINFTVTLSPASSQTVTTAYATADGTAKAGSDYTPVSDILTFNPGDTAKTISVQVLGDAVAEDDETFSVNLSNAVNAGMGDRRGTATILNDDPSVGISINNVSVSEGDSGTRNAIFTVSLSAVSAQAVTVDYSTSDGSAAAGSDYNFASGVLSFAPGEVFKTITVQAVGDTIDEGNETFFVNLANPVNAAISDNKGTGTIMDDDPTPGLSINNISVIEGNSGMASAVFTISLSVAGKQPITVGYSTSDGTAAAGIDYIGASGLLTFAVGEVNKSITVQVVGDAAGEADETFFVNLSNPVNANLSDARGIGTIVNDDPTVGISINDISVLEGNAGTTAAVFTVSLSSTSSQTISVNFGTTNGTAISGSDYMALSGSVSFAPGEVTKSITVQILGDVVDEGNETFSINLSNPVNASITDVKGVCTILDDDPTPPSVTPKLSINNVSVTEGDSGTRSAVFTVSLSSVSNQTVTVSYASADGTAKAGSDYNPVSGLLSFAPGQTAKTIAVQVIGDAIGEGDENFTVKLSNPINAAFADRTGTCTILDDDPSVNISVNNVSVSEGDSGTRQANFTVSLSIAGKLPITVNYGTSDGTAAAGSDYIAASGSLSFAPGETAKTIPVMVIGDAANESNETFFLNLSNPVNAAIGDGKGTGTILDDDPTVGISINNVSVTEGNSGTRNAIFTVSLSAVSGQTVMVSYATSDGTATVGSDYIGASGALAFAPGEVAKTISVQVIGDSFGEGNETFNVNLSNQVNAALSDSRGIGTIIDDDPTIGISINDISVLEGNAGTVFAVFTVSLSSASSQTVTVNFGTTNGAAISGSDYGAVSGTLSFAPGEILKTISVQIIGDAVDENNETFFVNLTNSVNAVIVDGKGTGTIIDDDPTAP